MSRRSPEIQNPIILEFQNFGIPEFWNSGILKVRASQFRHHFLDSSSYYPTLSEMSLVPLRNYTEESIARHMGCAKRPRNIFSGGYPIYINEYWKLILLSLILLTNGIIHPCASFGKTGFKLPISNESVLVYMIQIKISVILTPSGLCIWPLV